MPKIVEELSDATVRKLKHGTIKGVRKTQMRSIGDPCTAYHSVGGVSGLLLQCRPPMHNNELGARSWILRVKVGGKRRDIGLGGYPDVTLSKARELAREYKEKIKGGIDPVEEKKKAKRRLIVSQAKMITFNQAAEKFLAGKVREFKNPKHAAQWGSTLNSYASPIIGEIPVAEIELNNIVQVLQPIWLEKTETAKRLRGRIESVLSWATVGGFRSGLNPARWKDNLEHVLQNPSKITKVKRHSALPYHQINLFLGDLKKRTGSAAKALELLILTAARSGEIRGATWEEIDLNQRLWTIPAERMKASKEHRVPLSDVAMALLEGLPHMDGSDYVFPAPRGGELSDMSISAVVRRINESLISDGEKEYIDPKSNRAIVPHGFRSTFRDWCAEQTNYPNVVAEMALAHTISNQVEAAYRRGDLIEKRTLLMQEWANYCNTEHKSGKVVSIQEAVA